MRIAVNPRCVGQRMTGTETYLIQHLLVRLRLSMLRCLAHGLVRTECVMSSPETQRILWCRETARES